MNRQERELRMHAILTEIKGMEAENLRYGNNPPYREIAFNFKAAELRALAAELEKEITPELPCHPDPLYKVGQVVRCENNNVLVITKSAFWNDGEWCYPAIMGHVQEKYLKPYTPTFTVGDTVQVLDIPVNTKVILNKNNSITILNFMISTDKKQVTHVDKEANVIKLSNRFWYHPSWLVKCEQERTVEVGQWWKPERSDVIGEIDDVNPVSIHVKGIGHYSHKGVLAGKQYRVEEIK